MQILISYESGTDYVIAEWYTEGENLRMTFPRKVTVGEVLEGMAEYKLRIAKQRQPSRPRRK